MQSYIVVEPDPVVSMDLVETLQGAFDDARVIAAQSVPEAIDAIACAPKNAYILFNHEIVTDLALQILRKRASQGASVVFIGKCASTDFPSRTFDVPFSSKMVLSALAAQPAMSAPSALA